MAELVYQLRSGAVIDRKELNKIPSDKLVATYEEIRAKNPVILVVDNVKDFFSEAAIMKAVDSGEDLTTLALRLDYYGAALLNSDVALIGRFLDLKKLIHNAIAAKAPVLPPYEFADIPEGWSVEKNINISSDRYRRRGSGPTNHTLGKKTAQNIWNYAALRWKTGKTVGNGSISVSAGGRHRRARVYDDRVEIGCQNVQRYELEQLALHEGWAFPE